LLVTLAENQLHHLPFVNESAMLADFVVNKYVLFECFTTGNDAIVVLIYSAMLLLTLLHSPDEVTHLIL
jgi:hypothetical protein